MIDQQQKVHSAPSLDHRLLIPPPSILQKNANSSPTIPKHVVIDDNSERRRSSAVIFASNDSSNSHTTIFYDALSTPSEPANDDDNNEEQVEAQKLQRSNNNKKRNSRSLMEDWKNRRSSLMSHISSAYTNKTTAITIDHVDLDPNQYLHQSVLLCAIVSTQQRRIEEHVKYHHYNEFRKIPLKWQEYRALITESGYLELYNMCNCKNEV